MKISMKNFGPIYKASINLKPLTIVIGRNNLGKSFIGQLIYSIVCSLNKPPNRVFGGQFPNVGLLDLVKYIMPDSETQKKQISKLFNRNISLDSYTNSFTGFLKAELSDDLKTLLEDALTSTFGVELENLINYREETTSFSFTLEPNATFSITINDEGVLSVETEFSSTFTTHISRIIRNNYEQYRNSNKPQRTFLDSVFNNIYDYLLNHYIFSNSYLLPAGRAGLIDSWDTIASTLINLASVAIPQGLSMPALPGTAAKLYNALYFAGKRKKGGAPKFTSNFRNLLSGDIVTTESSRTKRKEFLYEFGKKTEKFNVNIIHAASMIKEIAPFYLIAKDLITENDLLIYEEPEAHLHPKTQTQLIHILIEMLKINVNFFLTTHSDIFLRSVVTELAKHQESTTDSKKLSSKDLSIIFLRESKYGSVSRPIRTTKFGTLDNIPSFDEITNNLYDQETCLEMLHND